MKNLIVILGCIFGLVIVGLLFFAYMLVSIEINGSGRQFVNARQETYYTFDGSRPGGSAILFTSTFKEWRDPLLRYKPLLRSTEYYSIALSALPPSHPSDVMRIQEIHAYADQCLSFNQLDAIEFRWTVHDSENYQDPRQDIWSYVSGRDGTLYVDWKAYTGDTSGQYDVPVETVYNTEKVIASVVHAAQKRDNGAGVLLASDCYIDAHIFGWSREWKVSITSSALKSSENYIVDADTLKAWW